MELKGRAFIAGLTLAFSLFHAAVALAAPVPAILRSAIIVRSIGYERTFTQRRGEAVFAIVMSNSPDSLQDGGAVRDAMTQLIAGADVAGRRVKIVEVRHDSVEKTAERLAAVGAEVVYLAQGLESIAGRLPVSSAGRGRISVCADGGDVEKGCVLGVELNGDKPRLVLNLAQTNAAKLAFDSRLLRLARIVR